MLISSCPECHERVSFLGGVDDHARIACPWCRAEYTAGQLLKSLPPAVILLDAPVASESQAKTEFGLTTEGEAELTLSPADPALAVPNPPGHPFQFDVAPSTPPAAVGPEIRQVPTESRSTGEQRGFGAEIVKIALGGIVGLVIAQGLIWWMPWGLGRDPFNLAPQLPAPLAILAPAKFRPTAPSDSIQSHGNDAIEAEARRFDSDDEDSTDASTITDQGIPKNELRERDDRDLTGDDIANGVTSPEETSENEPLSGRDDFNSLAAEQNQSGLRDRPVFRMADVSQSLEQLEAIDDPWSTSDVRRLARSFKSACELAWRLTFIVPEGESLDPSVDTVDQTLSERVDLLLAPLTQDPGALSRIADIGAVWLDGKKRSVDGVLLAGTVQSMEREGAYLATRIDLLGSKARTVPVLSSPRSDDNYSVGDRVLILGAIIANPAADLISFSGDDPLVVLRGHVHILPPAAQTN